MNAAMTIMTESDRFRLQGVVDAMFPSANGQQRHLAALQGKLDGAQVVPPASVPADVITMNSRFRLRHLKADTEETYLLAFPTQANPLEGRLSVIDSMGIAVLGCRVGEMVEWPTGQGGPRLRVAEILFQPEREGCFNL